MKKSKFTNSSPCSHLRTHPLQYRSSLGLFLLSCPRAKSVRNAGKRNGTSRAGGGSGGRAHPSLPAALSAGWLVGWPVGRVAERHAARTVAATAAAWRRAAESTATRASSTKLSCSWHPSSPPASRSSMSGLFVASAVSSAHRVVLASSRISKWYCGIALCLGRWLTAGARCTRSKLCTGSCTND